MSACGSSLRHINLPEKPSPSSSSSLIDSFSSWNQIIALKPPVDHSFTEIFEEFRFKENPDAISKVSEGCDNNSVYQGSYHKKSDSFSSLNLESLQLCTEGLGSESIDDVEDMKIDFPGSWQNHNKSSSEKENNDCSYKDNNSFKMGEKMPVRGYTGYQYRKEKTNGKTFPPPISCIGKTGKPCVCFQSYRQDGRFVLKEMRIPTHERLQSSREDGRLRLCFIQPSDQDEDDACETVDDGGEEKVQEESEVRDDIERGHS